VPRKPEILPPETRPVRIGPFPVPSFTKTILRWGAILAFLGWAGWSLQNFFQLRGIVNVFASRINLAFMCIAVFAAFWLGTAQSERRVAWRVSVAVIMILAAFALDWWAPKPSVAPPSPPAKSAVAVPELGGELGAHVLESKTFGTVVLLNGIITNRTGPATSLLGWKLRVLMPNGSLIEGQPLAAEESNVDISIPEKTYKLALHPEDYGPTVTQRQIPGGNTSGGFWFWGTIKLRSEELVTGNVQAELEFSDVLTGNKHFLHALIPESKAHSSTIHAQVEYPTMEDIAVSTHNPLIPALRVGEKPVVPIGFENASAITVKSPADAGIVRLVSRNRHATAFGDHRSELESEFNPPGGDIPPHSDTLGWHSYEGPILSSKDIGNLIEGVVDLCGFGAVRWGDDTGRYETYFAQCLMVEKDHRSFSWHMLRENNTERRIQ